MRQNKLFYPPIIYILSILYIILSYVVLAMGDEILQISIHEDQYFELVSAVGFFITAILFLVSFFLTHRRKHEHPWSWMAPVIFLGLFILFVFGAGEEISWGQRIFGFDTPDYLSSVNKQDELNLHNLAAIDAGQFFSADRLFDIFWITFTIILPLGYTLVPFVRTRIAERFGYSVPIPHWSLGVLFLFNYLWAKVAKIIFQAGYTYQLIPFKQAVQEIKECNYAILFVLVGLSFILTYRQKQS